MSYEVLTAFFLEAGFLGIMLFGRDRVPKWVHFFATCMVALGTLVSAFWILAANSWMQTPVGLRVAEDGVDGTAYVLASETCALDLIHAEFVRDIEPGEIICIDSSGIKSVNPWKNTQQPHSLCIFEYVYFARPDSMIMRHNIANVRINLGRAIARETPVGADLVIRVPIGHFSV